MTVPRYLPDQALPHYRHCPGRTPHPSKDPEGHSYGACHSYTGSPLTVDNWPRHTAYLRGVDLFNHAYWWEAHEAWEGPWRRSAAVEAQFLQGLIQAGAALVKWRQGQRPGQDRLYHKGREKLLQAQVVAPLYMGLNIAGFLQCLQSLLGQEPASVDMAGGCGLIHLEFQKPLLKPNESA